MPTEVTCPMCQQSGCISLLGSIDHTGQPPYEHDNIGAAIRLHFLCGACALRFAFTFVHRRASVIIETTIQATR